MSYKTDFEEGDLLRIAKPVETFRKGHTQNYTAEMFKVFRIATLSPPIYNLVDAKNKKNRRIVLRTRASQSKCVFN